VDDPRTSLEFRLLGQADKIRGVLVGLFLFVVYTAPREEMRSFHFAAVVVVFSALYAVFSHFVLNWRSVRSEGHVSLMAGLLVCADLFCVSAFAWAVGPHFSSLATLLLLDVVFTATFFSGYEIVLVVSTVCCAYYLLAQASGDPGATWQVIGQSGATVVVGWFTHVLSEVRRREAAVTDRIVRNLTEGVLLISAEGRINLVNPRTEQMAGVKAKEVLGLRIGDPGAKQALAPLTPLLGDVEEGIRASSPERAPRSTNVRIEDPAPMEVQVLTVPCAAERGGVAGWVVVCRDVTAVLSDVRAREEGLAAASHELRGRIHSVRAATEVLTAMAHELSPQMHSEALALLDGETSRLSRLIARILDAAVIERGEMRLRAEPVDLGELARAVCDGLQPLATEKQITLQLKAAPGLPAVFGDRERLDQVVQNLVENALKFTPEGGAVQVRVHAAEGEVVVAVSDNGQGIPEDRRDVIFRKFVRDEEHARISRSAGLGLGLYITEEIVRSHHGRIDVESQEGAGSTFTVALPILPLIDEGSPEG
jgi:PAS domain S-box-containing protein